MKSITLEEHFILPEVKDEMAKLVQPDPEGVPLKTMLEALESKTGFTDDDEIQNHEQRIKFMEEHNVAVQILSYGNGAPSNLTGEKAIELCRYANDKLYGYIEMYPERFLGFACIPINEPQAAAEELERAVTQLGFKGVLIPVRPHDGFLEQEKYDVIFAKAEALGVPIYLHPAPVNADVYQSYYKSDAYTDATAASFASFGYGWHVDVGIHAIHLVLGGVFDKHPNLQMIIGHWGEFIPFFLERMDEALLSDHLVHPISQYFKNHFYITPSGMLTHPQFEMVKNAFGIDRILYAADYPYIKPEKLGTFLNDLGLSLEDQAKINYKNAQHLLKLNHNHVSAKKN